MQARIKDTSIFQGIKQFKINDSEYRCENIGNGYWAIFKLYNNSFLHVGTAFVKGNASCRKIYDAYMSED